MYRRLMLRRPVLWPLMLVLLGAKSLASYAAHNAINIGHDTELRQLKPDVFVVTHDNANALMVKMGNGEIVVVNTLYHPEVAEALLSWIRGHYQRDPSAAINTHFHNDTLGGNGAFIAHGIPVYGSDLTVETLRQREASMRSLLLGWAKTPEEKNKIATQKFIPPTRAFAAKSGLVLNFGGEQVILEYPGPAHSPDNIVVYFPKQKILFGGCMIMAGAKVGNKSDADLAMWPKALDRVRKFPFDHIVPGHGLRFDRGLLDHTRKLLAEDVAQ